MSLGIVVKGSEGMVLAADSRLTLTVTMQEDPAKPNTKVQFPINYDNATKLLTFAEPNKWVGAVTFGAATIGQSASDLRTAQSYVAEFEVGLAPDQRLPIADFAQRLSDFFLRQWKAKMPANYQGQNMEFIVAGFNENQPYGSVYLFAIPSRPAPVEQAPNDFGITWGGQPELTGRILQGYDPQILKIIQKELKTPMGALDNLQKAFQPLQLQIPYQVLPLQDCIDLAIFLIRTTITAQNLSIGIRGVGGVIDVAAITKRDGLTIIQRKELTGEQGRRQRKEEL
jgi:hypothetical protein